MKERDNRFLVKLGITQGPWEYEKLKLSGPIHQANTVNRIIADNEVITDDIYRDSDCTLIVQSPAMFLSLFYRVNDDLCNNDHNNITDCGCCNCTNLAADILIIEAAVGKTITKIQEIWEATA